MDEGGVQQVGEGAVEVRLEAARAPGGVAVADARENEGGVDVLLGVHALPAEVTDEVHVRVVAHKVRLAGLVEGQDLGPDADEHLPQVRRGRLEELEHVGEDADAEREVDGVRAQLEEPPQ